MKNTVVEQLSPDVLEVLKDSLVKDVSHVSTESLVMLCPTHGIPSNYHETKNERIKRRMRSGEPYSPEPFPENPRVNQEQMTSHFSGKYTEGYNYGFALYDEKGRPGGGYCFDVGSSAHVILLGKEGRGMGHALLVLFGEPHDHENHLGEVASYLSKTETNVRLLTEHLLELRGKDKEVGVSCETAGGLPSQYRLYTTGSKDDFFWPLRFEDQRLPYEGGINERQLLSVLLHRSRRAEESSWDDDEKDELRKISEHLTSALEGFKRLRKKEDDASLATMEPLREEHAQFMEKRLRRELEAEDEKNV